MMIARAEVPRNLTSLSARIRNIAQSQGRPQRRLELAVAHTVVILVREEHPDLALVSETARRLFTARRAQAWPPIVITYPRWDTIYAAAAEGLDVIENVDDAVAWANRLIADIG